MKKNTLLYQIEGRNICSPSYIFGTMHVRDHTAFRGIHRFKECIDLADSFAAEFDFQNVDYQAFEKASTLPDAASLADYINLRVYRKLARVFYRETGTELDLLQHRSPLILLNMIADAQFGQDETHALDYALYLCAQAAGKQLLGLESFESQMHVFSKVPLKEQSRNLKKIALNFKAYRRDIAKAAALYRARDIQKLYQKTKKSIGSMRNVLLYDRNRTMAYKFVDYAQQKSIFAAVGAGHLGGSKGVLRLLKKKGLGIRPIYYD